MNRAVDKWIDDHKEELIEALRANLSIASVKDTEHASEGYSASGENESVGALAT